jgi:hypothetical protein
LAPQFRGLFDRLGPAITASKRGLPALDRILGDIPPLLAAFQPFLRNADPMVRYIGMFKPAITGFFANVADSAQSASGAGSQGSAPYVHYVRASQTLSPFELASLPRPLGSDRNDAYRTPSAYDRLGTGLTVLNTTECANRNPAPPSSTNPASLAQLIQQYVYRSSGRNIAVPPCKAQRTIPGFTTAFPQLHADPLPSVGGG